MSPGLALLPLVPCTALVLTPVRSFPETPVKVTIYGSPPVGVISTAPGRPVSRCIGGALANCRVVSWLKLNA